LTDTALANPSALTVSRCVAGLPFVTTAAVSSSTILIALVPVLHVVETMSRLADAVPTFQVIGSIAVQIKQTICVVAATGIQLTTAARAAAIDVGLVTIFDLVDAVMRDANVVRRTQTELGPVVGDTLQTV
jgi:hypothetical protein